MKRKVNKMWIVEVCDTEINETYEIMVNDNYEFQQLFDFIKMSPNLELHHVEERCICPGVDVFIEEMRDSRNR